jgi:hypothetical protein
MWCERCGQQFWAGHNSVLNPMGCNLPQRNSFKWWALMMLWIVTLIILFPVMLVLFVPSYVGWKAGSFTSEQYLMK